MAHLGCAIADELARADPDFRSYLLFLIRRSVVDVSYIVSDVLLTQHKVL